jgi:hypothetical protein
VHSIWLAGTLALALGGWRLRGGDVGSGSVKRVAFAVGEGAMAIRLVREHRARVR